MKFRTLLGRSGRVFLTDMNKQSERSSRAKQFKVWTVMAATLILGVLLAFGRWASDDPTLMGFGSVAWKAFPAGWVLAIEYGVIVLMVAVLIRGDRVDELLSSPETLTWLGGIGLFTAGLYHNPSSWAAVWAVGVNGYGSLTEFVRLPSLLRLPLLLSAWPMVYGMIATTISFVAVMGWKRPIFRWRWVLPALFLVTVTSTWITLVLWPWNLRGDSRWLAGSLVVLPLLVVAVVLVRDPERKIHWMNLIASAWLATALFPQLDVGGVVLPMSEGLARMHHGYGILVLGDLLVLSGSLAALFSRNGESAFPRCNKACFDYK
jgi:hypothetical protein